MSIKISFNLVVLTHFLQASMLKQQQSSNTSLPLQFESVQQWSVNTPSTASLSDSSLSSQLNGTLVLVWCMPVCHFLQLPQHIVYVKPCHTTEILDRTAS
jgi:hypothetical protein